MELPVIVTNFSGPTAYLTDDNAFPIRVTKVHANRQAEPDNKHLREQMRRVATDRAIAEAVGARARADMIERFSANKVGDVVLQRLTEVVLAKGSPDADHRPH